MKETELYGCGLVESLYHYLWLKNKMDNNAPIKLNLPDTIVYRSGKPCYWYFTARDGSIKRKNSANVTSEEILSSFRARTRCEIVGVFMYSTKNVSAKYEIGLRIDLAAAVREGTEEGGDRLDELEKETLKAETFKSHPRVIFEYFDIAGLGASLDLFID
jgi:hypothetical protein